MDKVTTCHNMSQHVLDKRWGNGAVVMLCIYTTVEATGRSSILTPHVARAILADNNAAPRAVCAHEREGGGREGGRERVCVWVGGCT